MEATTVRPSRPRGERELRRETIHGDIERGIRLAHDDDVVAVADPDVGVVFVVLRGEDRDTG